MRASGDEEQDEIAASKLVRVHHHLCGNWVKGRIGEKITRSQKHACVRNNVWGAKEVCAHPVRRTRMR